VRPVFESVGDKPCLVTSVFSYVLFNPSLLFVYENPQQNKTTSPLPFIWISYVAYESVKFYGTVSCFLRGQCK